MRLATVTLALALTVPISAPAAELDYAELTFPRDAKELIVDPAEYRDSLEYIDDKILASVKRLYAAAFLDNVMAVCGEKGFWSGLKKLPTTAGSFLAEIRANKDLDQTLQHSKHIRDALKQGAKSIGIADSEKLVAQGLCDVLKK